MSLGEWQQHQLWDGTYDLDDLLNWHEMVTVREENKRRARDSMVQIPQKHKHLDDVIKTI